MVPDEDEDTVENIDWSSFSNWEKSLFIR